MTPIEYVLTVLAIVAATPFVLYLTVKLGRAGWLSANRYFDKENDNAKRSRRP